MPKPLHRVSPKVIDILRNHIGLRASVPITSKADCVRLSSIIESKLKRKISVSTIYRVFLHPKPTTPYVHTLDVLAQYCNFKDWHDFEIRASQAEKLDVLTNDISLSSQPIDSLIKICIHQNQLKPVLTYASQFTFPVDPELGQRLGYEIYQALADNPNGNDRFFRHAHRLPLIRTCFFEMMADQNFLLQDYENGIKYFTSSARPGKGEGPGHDYLFGNCLLFRHYYIQKRKEEALAVGKLLYQKNKLPLDQMHQFSLHISARYLAYKFWFYLLMGQPSKLRQYLTEIRSYWADHMQVWRETEKKGILFHFGDVFCESPPLSHLEIVLKAHFSDFLETIPDFEMDKPLKKYLPVFDLSPLSLARLNGKHALASDVRSS